jgi:hypothetical protein
MADTRGFEYVQLWAAWKSQTVETQRGWMMGKGGLKPILEDFMKNFPRNIQDEVFECAPEDVCKVFGYERIPDKSERVVASRYNPNRQKAVLKRPELSQVQKNNLRSILEA